MPARGRETAQRRQRAIETGKRRTFDNVDDCYPENVRDGILNPITGLRDDCSSLNKRKDVRLDIVLVGIYTTHHTVTDEDETRGLVTTRVDRSQETDQIVCHALEFHACLFPVFFLS